MSPGVSTLALVLCAGTTDGAARAIDAAERSPLALLLFTPEAQTRTSSPELVRVMREVLEQHTDLALVEHDPRSDERVACRGGLGCLAASLAGRPGGDLPAPGRAPERGALLLVLSRVVRGGGAPDKLSLVLVDVPIARELSLRSRGPGMEGEVELERHVSEGGAVLARATTEVSGDEDSARWLLGLMRGELRSVLEQRGRWEPFGTVRLEVEQGDLSITLDERVVGTTAPGVTELRRVRAGPHTLELTGPEVVPWRRQISVALGEVAVVDADVRDTGGPAPIVRAGVIATGLAGVGAGVVLGVVAIASASDQSRTCLVIRDGGATDCGEGSAQARFGDVSSTELDGAFGASRGGVAIAPLAGGLAALGLTWTIGTLLFGEREEVPWIPLVAGLAAFGVTYGAALAADGGL